MDRIELETLVDTLVSRIKKDKKANKALAKYAKLMFNKQSPPVFYETSRVELVLGTLGWVLGDEFERDLGDYLRDTIGNSRVGHLAKKRRLEQFLKKHSEKNIGEKK